MAKDLTIELNREYRFRYDKNVDHKSMLALSEIQEHRFPSLGLTPFPQAMPDIYKVKGNPVLAYRHFYLGDKAKFAKWTKRNPPDWYVNG